ncbi:hypothetical protein B4135_3903 [Caldibacillus debilis]|uniref:Uncharacterized protein n=1 Tax=Caldibacillus debilis TaxID=301148 RepID=A0A150LB78_9BACI|nr:hypothetical protein B4135_3903 [Caldibacillus debilis]
MVSISLSLSCKRIFSFLTLPNFSFSRNEKPLKTAGGGKARLAAAGIETWEGQ